jgi:hypothetical protein
MGYRSPCVCHQYEARPEKRSAVAVRYPLASGFASALRQSQGWSDSVNGILARFSLTENLDRA